MSACRDRTGTVLDVNAPTNTPANASINAVADATKDSADGPSTRTSYQVDVTTYRKASNQRHVLLHHENTWKTRGRDADPNADAYATTPSSCHETRSNRRGDWEDVSRTAPLATPETLSETSSNPPSPIPPPRPMRRTPKIPGNLSTAADDLKNNLHFAMLSAKNYFLREENIGSNSSSGNSEASYESAKSLTTDLPPPVPRRRDSVTIRREQRVCTAACCRDDLSENSSTRASSHSSRVSRTSHHVQVDFPEGDNETNGSSLDFFEAKGSSGQRDSSNDVFLSVRSSPECKGLMAPATDLGAEWKRRFDATGISGDASLPLLRGLSPTPTTAQHSSSPFFNAKRKKYVYPITLMGRGESSV